MYNFKDVRKNENKGFSLVELIVVIAIMAVMTSVLAPALLQYVERSRAQKDDSAMGEVSNAIMLALSDQNIYDEVLYYACTNQYACYVDSQEPDDVVDTGNTDVVIYGDNDRQLDEVEYYVDGKMRGVTITFQPDKDTNASQFTLADAIVNKFVRSGDDVTNTEDGGKINADTIKKPSSPLSGQKYYTSGGPAYATYGTLKTMCAGSNTSNHFLYNRVRSVIGDTVVLTSQTYRNSEYTIFIRIGSTGGNQADAQDAIKVYGQWNGTNLLAG
jgi:prepilin-type N-terminal cleavage/methylation domain-containing protein